MRRSNAPFVGLLTLLTLGFYGIHWFGEQKEFIEGRGGKVPSAWLYGIVVFLLPVDIIASLWVQSTYIEQAQSLSQYFLWAGIAIAVLSALLYIHWSAKYNSSLDQATAGSVTSKLTILPFGLGFLGFWNLQSAVNNYHLDTMTVPAAQTPDSNAFAGLVAGDMDGSDWQQGISTIQTSTTPAPILQTSGSIATNIPQKEPTYTTAAPPQSMPPTQVANTPDTPSLTGAGWQQGLNTVNEPQNQMPELPPDPMDQSGYSPTAPQAQPEPNQPVNSNENSNLMPGSVVPAQPTNPQNPYNNNGA